MMGHKVTAMRQAIAKNLGMDYPSGNSRAARAERAMVDEQIDREVERYMASVPDADRDAEIREAYVEKNGMIPMGRARMWSQPKPPDEGVADRINNAWRRAARRKGRRPDWDRAIYPGAKDVVFRSPDGVELSTNLSCAVGLQDVLGGCVVGFEDWFPPTGVPDFDDELPFG